VQERRSQLTQLFERLTLASGLAERRGVEQIFQVLTEPRQTYLGAKRQLIIRALKKISGIRTDYVNIKRLSERIIQISGNTISKTSMDSVMDLLPSTAVPVTAHMKIRFSQYRNQKNIESQYTISENADEAYSRTTRIIEAVEIKDFKR